MLLFLNYNFTVSLCAQGKPYFSEAIQGRFREKIMGLSRPLPEVDIRSADFEVTEDGEIIPIIVVVEAMIWQTEFLRPVTLRYSSKVSISLKYLKSLLY